MSGPLAGVRVVEMAGDGPVPFAAMLLADMGADVTVIDRVERAVAAPLESARNNVYGRGRRSVALDLKHRDGPETLLRMLDGADVFLECWRPGVAERLGIGPEVACARNPGLVYGRMTGWGQDGPMADRAGHDVNYIALAGPLAHIGRSGQPPTVPPPLVGDFGGGGAFMVIGVCAALVERATSGRGQVIDAAMVDGSALLLAATFPAYYGGWFHTERASNALDGGAHYYQVYECADGRYVSVGAVEPKFYERLLAALGLADEPDLPDQDDQDHWPAMTERFAAIFAGRTRDEWVDHFADFDACFAPVLTVREASGHEHLVARGTYVTRDGVVQPAPAPRFSRTSAELDRPPAPAGHHTREVLADYGFTASEVEALRGDGAVA